MTGLAPDQTLSSLSVASDPFDGIMPSFKLAWGCRVVLVSGILDGCWKSKTILQSAAGLCSLSAKENRSRLKDTIISLLIQS